MALVGGGWAIIKDMAEVRTAPRTQHLSPAHEQTRIGHVTDVLFAHWGPKAWPPGAGIKLRF